MRHPIHILALCCATISALQLPDFQPFLAAMPISISDYLPPTTGSMSPHEQKQQTQGQSPQQEAQPHNLFRRQSDNSCPSGYNSCSNIGGSGLCCSSNARCTADGAGHVACCPRGAACTGTIGAIRTGSGSSTGTGTEAATETETGDSGLLVTASTTQSADETGGVSSGDTLRTDGGFVLDGTQTVATPGAGLRGAEVPLVARAIVRLMEYMPV